MDTVEKLRTINYVCNTCKKCGYLMLSCVDPKKEMNEEDRFNMCEELRRRIENMDRVFNRTIYSEQIRQEIGRKE